MDGMTAVVIAPGFDLVRRKMIGWPHSALSAISASAAISHRIAHDPAPRAASPANDSTN